MVETQNILTVERGDLLAKTGELFAQGYRLVQICCTLKDSFELSYSFDKDHQFLVLRLQIPKDDPNVPSVSGVYFCAFAYENEMHDLFGLNVSGMAVDFKGAFYKTSVSFPFANESKGK